MATMTKPVAPASNGKPDPAPPAVYTGKEHPWARSLSSRLNHESALNQLPLWGFIGTTILFNRTTTALRFYTWLNATYTPFEINFWGSLLLTTAVYWIVGLTFMAVDMVPALYARAKAYKVQPDKHVTWREYRRVIAIVVRNQLLVNVPVSYTFARFVPRDTSTPLPGAWTTVWVYFACLLCEEVGFFVVHRAGHSRLLYARFHKMHHTFTAPVALAATYCTMTEHLCSNLAPILFAMWATGAHWSLSMMFFCSLSVGTLMTHSDYNIPGLYDSLQHDWHHYAFTENFGPTGLLDAIYKTNTGYNAWLAELKRRDKDGWRTNGRVELAKAAQ